MIDCILLQPLVCFQNVSYGFPVQIECIVCVWGGCLQQQLAELKISEGHINEKLWTQVDVASLLYIHAFENNQT